MLNALGYRQVLSNISMPIAYQGLRKGQIDVFLGQWLPAQEALAGPLVKANVIDVLGTNLHDARFTLAVPSYVAVAGVRNFGDLAKFADRFDRKVYGIEAGAAGNQLIKKMIDDKAFGLDRWSVIESSDTAMMTQVEHAIREKQWIVFLAWEPHVMNTRFQLTYLAGGDQYFGANYGAASVNTIARHGYADQCQNVGRLFSQMTFTVGMENQLIADMASRKSDPQDAARKILRQYPQVQDGWLKGVKTATGDDGAVAVQRALGP